MSWGSAEPNEVSGLSQLGWTRIWSVGDVAELADAKVSKTFGITSRVGSIPTIPTRGPECLRISRFWMNSRPAPAFRTSPSLESLEGEGLLRVSGRRDSWNARLGGPTVSPARWALRTRGTGWTSRTLLTFQTSPDSEAIGGQY